MERFREFGNLVKKIVINEFWKNEGTNAVTIATAIKITNMATDAIISRRDFMKVAGILSAGALNAANNPFPSSDEVSPFSNTVESQQRPSYFGEIDLKGNTMMAGEISINFGIDTADIHPFSFNVADNNKDATSTDPVSFEYAYAIDKGKLRTFVMTGTNVVELQRELAGAEGNKYFYEYYTWHDEKGFPYRHDVHVYPEDPTKISGNIFMYPAHNRYTQLKEYNGEPITVQFKDGVSKVYTTITEAALPFPKKEVLVSWQKHLGEKYVVNGDGTITDISKGEENKIDIPGITIQKDGTAKWVYEFDGNPDFTVTLDKFNLVPLESGELDFFQLAHKWNGKEYVKKEFQGEMLYSKFEAQAFLANNKNVDLSSPKASVARNLDPFVSDGKGRKILRYNKIVEPLREYYWFDNIIPFKDDSLPGGWRLEPTSSFIMVTMEDEPYSMISFTNKKGLVNVIFVDHGNLSGSQNYKIESVNWTDYYIDH